jgi:hypothetical protein
MSYLYDLNRNALAIAHELGNRELIELLEDAIQEMERIEPQLGEL